MGLAVVILGEVAASALLVLGQAAELPFRHRLIQHIAPDQPPGQCQDLSHRCNQTLCSQLAQNQLRFQCVHFPPEQDPGVIFGNQYLCVQVGHILRLFFQAGTVQQPVGFRSGQLRREDLDPLPA